MTEWTLVTGGSRGLGAALCKLLAKQGHAIALQYRTSEQAAQQVAEDCRAFGVEACCIKGDFSDDAEVGAFLDRYQQSCEYTRAIVNNASEYHLGKASATGYAIWQQLFQVNVYAPLAITNALLPSLERCDGAIVNLGVAGILKQHPDTHASAYFASKAALWAITRSWAKECAPHNVSCNMVSPGYLEASEDHPIDSDRLPMQRYASLDEVARVVAFLLAEENRYITGQNIEIAGAVRL